MRALSIQGRPARVHVDGRGPAVLLLHGVPTSAMLWRAVADALVAAGQRVLVPDLPGWGGSARLTVPPSPAAYADWLKDLLDQLGEPEAIVAGHDLGGLLALELLVAGRARAAALSSAWAGLGWTGARLTALPGLERFFYRRYGGRLYVGRGAAPDRRAAALDHFGPALADPAVVPHMRDIARGLSPRRLHGLARRVRATGRPVRCLWGAGDPFIPPLAARVVARRLDARLVLLPGARHLAPFDRPAPMADALLRFIGDVDAEPGGGPAR